MVALGNVGLIGTARCRSRLRRRWDGAGRPTPRKSTSTRKCGSTCGSTSFLGILILLSLVQSAVAHRRMPGIFDEQWALRKGSEAEYVMASIVVMELTKYILSIPQVPEMHGKIYGESSRLLRVCDGLQEAVLGSMDDKKLCRL